MNTWTHETLPITVERVPAGWQIVWRGHTVIKSHVHSGKGARQRLIQKVENGCGMVDGWHFMNSREYNRKRKKARIAGLR